MVKMPLVTIAMPVFNGENYFANALESVVNQSYENLQIIVCDDGSKNSEFVKSVVESFNDQRIEYFRKDNQGVGSALNLTIEKARGKYWTWLSHDDIYLADKIKIQVQDLNFMDDPNVISYSNFIYINEFGTELEKSDHETNLKENWHFHGPLELGLLSGCTLMLGADFIRKVGKFNETLLFTQDYDYWLRSQKSGGKFKLLSEHLVKVRLHENQTGRLKDTKKENHELQIKIAENFINQVKKEPISHEMVLELKKYLQQANSNSQLGAVEVYGNFLNGLEKAKFFRYLKFFR